MGEPASQLPESASAPAAPRYRLLFPLGHGGMGTVHLAIDEGKGGVRRMVAVKRMLPGDAREANLVELFLREARLAVLLNHPNVVRAFEFGDLEDEPYLAMEYVEGKTLEKLLSAAQKRELRLPPRVIAAVLADVCSALHAVHELSDLDGEPLSVVHRDVSPHNVMVSYDGHVVLLDFGISKMDAGPKLTVTGHVRGKLAYMSPEQARSEPLDRRSDLFGVGSMLYEAVAGVPLWGTGTDFEILKRLSTGETPALEADEDLRAIYNKLVATAPAARFATAKEAASALQRYARTVVGGDAPEATLSELLDDLFDGVRRAERKRIADAVAKSDAVAPSGRSPARPPESAEVPAVAKAVDPAQNHKADAGVVPESETPVARARRVWPVAMALGVVVIAGAAVAFTGSEQGTLPVRTLGAEGVLRRFAAPSAVTTPTGIAPASAASSSPSSVAPVAASSVLSAARPRPSATTPVSAMPTVAATVAAKPTATSDVDNHPF